MVTFNICLCRDTGAVGVNLTYIIFLGFFVVLLDNISKLTAGVIV